MDSEEVAMPSPCPRGTESARTTLSRQLEIIDEHREGVRVFDIDAIHDMRVASRRLRMALQIYRPYLDKKARKAVKKAARTVGRALGRRRELDVMVAMLREHREDAHGLWERFMDHAIGILEGRREREARACQEALEAVEDPSFATARQQLLDTIDSTPLCVVDLAEAELLDAFAAVQAARKFWKKTGDAEDLHEVRIDLKRFRYACEFHKTLYGEPMEAYIARLKEAQSTLGEWNECRVLEEMVLILGNAAPYDIAQGAPLVAEAYSGRVEVLEEQFVSLGKDLFGKRGKMEFEALLAENAVACCD